MFAKLNDYFGLESRSDRILYYGTFIVGGVLFLIDMAIAYIL
ncbi:MULTISPECIES: hypothetical protein [Bacillus cereus group]|nr:MULTISPECIES: hypothetical protein [Bacillus cereus group]MCU5635356.1 hypothetical protein [Bacillus cereus]